MADKRFTPSGEYVECPLCKGQGGFYENDPPAVLRELEEVEKALRAAVENNPYDDDLELYSACLRGADAIARVRRKLGGEG